MTYEAKHTPGPWGIRQSKAIMNNAMLITASEDNGKTFGGHIVTQLCDPTTYKNCKNFTPEEQIANARLIAAAPRLLEVAMFVANELGYLIDEAPTEDEGRGFHLLVAAIAEATADPGIRTGCIEPHLEVRNG